MASKRHSAFRSGKPGSRRGAVGITSNVCAMLTTNLVHKITVFLTYIMMARYRGAYQFGQLALAIALLYACHKIALIGLQTLLTRDVARSRTLTVPYFVHASILAAAAAAVVTFLIVPFVRLMSYGHNTAEVICLLFAGLGPLVLSRISEGVFQGWERMHLIAYVNVPVALLRCVAVFTALELGYGVRVVVLVFVASYYATMLLQWCIVVVSLGNVRVKPNRRLAVTMARASSVFLGIQATYAIRSITIVVVLSKLCGETSVGLYVAAIQLLMPLSLVFENVALSLFPVMCRSYEASAIELTVVTQRTIAGLMLIALPAAVGICILADVVVMAIYRDPQFMASVGVLRIIVWLSVESALTTVMGQALWASERERLSLRIAVVNTGLQLILSVPLIRLSGLMGAAASAVVAAVVILIQHAIPVTRLLSGLKVIAAMWRPLVGSAAMSLFVLSCRDLSLTVTIATAPVLYCLVLISLFVWTAGGIGAFKSACLQLWTT